ncbi:hypothetical protein CRUP_016225 [Coryphaenoides rupestris]|nr:hypothetical protein CRUP_016225 [Coryphaenoides rupestris]
MTGPLVPKHLTSPSALFSRGTDSMKASYILLFFALFFKMSLRNVARRLQGKALEQRVMVARLSRFQRSWPVAWNREHAGSGAAVCTYTLSLHIPLAAAWLPVDAAYPLLRFSNGDNNNNNNTSTLTDRASTAAAYCSARIVCLGV